MDMDKAACPDCGPNPVNHFAHKWLIYFEWLAGPLTRAFDFSAEIVKRLFGFKSLDRLGNLFVKATIGLGVFSETQITPGDNLRVRLAAAEADRRGIIMKRIKFFGLPTILYTARYGGKFIAFEQLPRPEGDYKNLKWIDNKAEVRKKLIRLNMPVAQGGRAFTLKQALKIFNETGKPAIVKPHTGSRSAHTTIHIKTEAELAEAFKKAKMLSPWAVVEKELEGFVHRITFIGGKLFAVIRREQPHVVGDGVLSVRELIAKENKNPRRDGSYFYPLLTDEAAEKEVRYQGLAWDSVPAAGQIVLLNQKAVGCLGSGLTDLTDAIHPGNVELFNKVDEILAVPFHGIDFITTDIARPWNEVPNCGIIECNSLPFLEMHHNPLVGRPRNAIGALWDLVAPR